MSDEILEFTRRALAADIDRHRISAALEKAGWPEASIKSSLSHYSDNTDFPMPVPVPPSHVSARDAFIYLLLFSAMALAIWNLCIVAFALIDYLMPDPHDLAALSRPFDSGALWNISILIVAFPIFAFMFYATNRRAADERARRLSLARQWLSYLVVFSAAMTLIGDLIVLVSSVISGNLSLPLFIKIALVATIIGGVFAFYLRLVFLEEFG